MRSLTLLILNGSILTTIISLFVFSSGQLPGHTINTSSIRVTTQSDRILYVGTHTCPSAEPAANASPSPTPVVGELVIAHWAGTTWSEGRVESIEGQRARILWTDNHSPADVELVDVYELPKAGGETNLKAGDYVLAKRSTWPDWEGAQVTMVSPGVINIKYASDLEDGVLPPEKVIAVAPAAAATIKADAARTEFLKKARALLPQAPPGYKPKVGARILGAWTATFWLGGRVKSIRDDKALIEWEGPPPGEVTLDRLVPYPMPEDGVTPLVGDYLLVKPSISGWDYVQVTSVIGTEIEVKDAYGESRKIKRGEFVVLK